MKKTAPLPAPPHPPSPTTRINKRKKGNQSPYPLPNMPNTLPNHLPKKGAAGGPGSAGSIRPPPCREGMAVLDLACLTCLTTKNPPVQGPRHPPRQPASLPFLSQEIDQNLHAKKKVFSPKKPPREGPKSAKIGKNSAKICKKTPPSAKSPSERLLDRFSNDFCSFLGCQNLVWYWQGQ